MENLIRDLVYLDVSKTVSILSQVEGGLLNQVQVGSETNRGDGRDLGFDVKLFKPSQRMTASDKWTNKNHGSHIMTFSCV